MKQSLCATAWGLAAVLALGCSSPSEVQAPASADQSVTPAESYALSPSQLAELERKAKAGDEKAMLAISTYYTFGTSQPRAAVPWLEMAVARGNTKAMKHLAMHLAVEGGTTNCDQAEDLFQRASHDVTNAAERAKLEISYNSFRGGVAAGRCGPRQ